MTGDSRAPGAFRNDSGSPRIDSEGAHRVLGVTEAAHGLVGTCAEPLVHWGFKKVVEDPDVAQVREGHGWDRPAAVHGDAYHRHVNECVKCGRIDDAEV